MLLDNIMKNRNRVNFWVTLGNFWQQKSSWNITDYFDPNSSDTTTTQQKIDLWGIFFTQFLSKNSIFISELKNIENLKFWKFTFLLIKSIKMDTLWKKSDFRNLWFSILFNSDVKIDFCDKNWLKKMSLESIFYCFI